jgi:hypothetical protein
MMRRLHMSLPQVALSGLLAGVGVLGVATAAPLPVATLGEAAASVEKIDWVPRCWWKQTYWGPQQVCRQVWVPSYNPGYGVYGDGGDWRWRHHHHHRRDGDGDWR